MIIAVDFDGTIVEHKYPAIGKERPFAISTLKQIAARGHRLVLWTAREGHLLDEAVDFCRERGLEFYAVNSDGPHTEFDGVTKSRKLRVDMFIDDRNLGGLPDWPTIYEMIIGNMTFEELYSSNDDEYVHKRKGNIFQRFADRIQESRDKVRRL